MSPHHTGDIGKTRIINFSYVKTLTYLAICGGGGVRGGLQESGSAYLAHPPSHFFIFLFYFFFFFFFRRQGFRMITFDRQAGPLQNFNRSHVMVIGRSVLFSDPARPPGGGVGRPKHPKIPPPRKINFCLYAFQNPRNIFEKKILVGKKTEIFRPPPPQKFFFIIFFAF